MLLVLLLGSAVALGRAAIRLEAAHRQPLPYKRSLADDIAVRRLRSHEAAVKRNNEAKEACKLANSTRPVQFAQIYGARPATWRPEIVGSEKFDVITRGGELLTATARISTKWTPSCEPRDDEAVDCPFVCTQDVDADCWALAVQLTSAWGYAGEKAWRDPATHIRARVRHGWVCMLQFDRYVEPHAWIAMNRTAEVPLGLLGAGVAQLPARALACEGDDACSQYNDEIMRYRWPLRVTGDHIGPATIEVSVERGRVVSLIVSGEIDEWDGADELHALVRPFFGRVPLEVWTGGGTFELRVGTVPY